MAKKQALPAPKKVSAEEANPRKKGGRPKKAPEERQENVVVVRFSTARYEQIAAHAQAGGRRMAEVVKEWMKKGAPAALTVEQHTCVRNLPSISNELQVIARLLAQQPDRQDQVAELLNLQERLGQLLTSFQR